jgi:hypothetical protein
MLPSEGFESVPETMNEVIGDARVFTRATTSDRNSIRFQAAGVKRTFQDVGPGSLR